MVGLDFFSLGFAFSLGIGTFFAPCAYPLLPGYVAYYLGDSDEEKNKVSRLRKAVTVALVVSAGFLAVYGVLAVIVSLFGTRLLTNISVLELVIGVILIAVGLVTLAGKSPFPHLTIQLPERERSIKGFFAFGVVYAGAAAGCTAPLFIAVVANSVGKGFVVGAGSVIAYAAGMSLLMIGVTVGTALGKTVLLSSMKPRSKQISRATGALMILAGIVQIYIFIFEFNGLSLIL